jgi:alkylated DNA repair dioxygenase AlkB
MTLSTQKSLFPGPLPEHDLSFYGKDSPWLGLVIGHRKLFQALEFDYLLLDFDQGIRLGINRYASNHEQTAPEHNINVYIKVCATLLPSVNLVKPGSSLEPTVPWTRVFNNEGVITWAYVLPVSTFTELSVEDDEQLNRLIGLAKIAGNISLPCSPSVNPSLKQLVSLQSSTLEYRRDPGDALRSIDSYRGAVSMALWGIPRVVPWIQSLLQSLSKTGQSRLDLQPSIPSWMRCLPWDKEARHNNADSDDTEICLWNSIIGELSCCAGNHEFDSARFIDNCAKSLSSNPSVQDSEAKRTIDYLCERTRLMLSGQAVIDINDQRVQCIGLALQLFILRPKPDQYKSWFVDYPDLSLPAWVAGLIFCGLLSGYHLLPSEYRGISPLRSGSNASRFRDLLLLHFLAYETVDALDASWPRTPVDTPLVILDGSDLVLTWDNIPFGVKHSSERMAWLVADYTDPQILDKAKRVSRILGWPCTTNYLSFPPGRYHVDGSALITVERSSAGPQLIVSDCDFRIQLPVSAAPVEILNIESFRHHLLAVGGDFKQKSIKNLTPVMESRSTPGGHNLLASNTILHNIIQITEISGLFVMPDFVSAAEERELLNRVESGYWSYVGSKSSSRRVQHYGWTYNYKARSVKPSDYIGTLPEWAESLAQRLFREGLMPYVADQLIINEYRTGQGISAHTDSPGSFHDTIVSISLLESWTMQFSRSLKGPSRPVLMPSRSALVLSGESRSSWLHEIRKRKKDESGASRTRRVSLTFRKVILP